MINKEIMNKTECLQDLKELLNKNPNNKYRLFKYGLNWYYIDLDYYLNQYNKIIKDENGNERVEFRDIKNQENTIIVSKDNIDNF